MLKAIDMLSCKVLALASSACLGCGGCCQSGHCARGCELDAPRHCPLHEFFPVIALQDSMCAQKECWTAQMRRKIEGTIRAQGTCGPSSLAPRSPAQHSSPLHQMKDAPSAPFVLL